MLKYQEKLDWDEVLKLLNALDPKYEYSYAFPGKAFGHAAGKAILRRVAYWPPSKADLVHDPLVVLHNLAFLAQENSVAAYQVLEGAKMLGYKEPDEDDIADVGTGELYSDSSL